MKSLILASIVVLFSFAASAGQLEEQVQEVVAQNIDSTIVSGDVKPGEDLSAVLKDYTDMAEHVFGGFFFGGDEDEDKPYDEKLKKLSFNCAKDHDKKIASCVFVMTYLKGKGKDTTLRFKVALDEQEKPVSIVENLVVVSKAR
jgi:hypothetical protein